MVMAGGLKTNSNQSAAWARTLTREASTGVDAVYFNPAGLAHLKNGLSLSVSNQSIWQDRTVGSDYALLSGTPKNYEAALTAPIYPSIYAAFKLDKWTFSAGFNLIGGGGTADFETGLPEFEMPVSQLVPYLQSTIAPLDQLMEQTTGTNPGFSNITGYNMDAAFSGSSIYYGVQAGATYALTDMLSVAIAARYVRVNNSYEGSLTGITIDAPAAYGGTQAPGDYGRFLAALPGMPPEIAAQMNGAAALLDEQTADQFLKSTQTGQGFTPIVGVNLRLTDMINIGARYEHRTKIELENDTETDDVGMFPDGAKTRADLPGQFSLGVDLQPLKKIKVSAGFNYFLDRSAYYGNFEVGDDGLPVMEDDGISFKQINNESTIDENAWTLGVAVEWRMLGPLGISAGYNFGNLGVNDDYQSGLDYANKNTSIGGGLFFELGELLIINAAYVHVMYDDYTKSYEGMPPYSETYGKSTGIFAIGVDIML